MNKSLTFVQILIAVVIGSIGSDVLKGIAVQCVSRNDRGVCTEKRMECLWNTRTTPFVIPYCFIEKQVSMIHFPYMTTLNLDTA